MNKCLFIHEVINVNIEYFTFNGMSLLYIKTICPKINGGNQNFESLCRFLLVSVKISKRYTRDMEIWKRTIIMSNQDDQEF